MTYFRMPRLAAKQPLETLADPKPADTAATADAGLGQKIDGRKANKKLRTAQFNTKVKKEFLVELDEALQQFCAGKGFETVSRGYFLEVLLYNWKQGNGQEIKPYGLPGLALEHAEAIASRMNWTLEQAIEDAIAVRCKDLEIDLNRRNARR